MNAKPKQKGHKYTRPKINYYPTAQLTDFAPQVVDAHIAFLIASDRCISFANNAQARKEIPQPWHHEIYDGRRNKEVACLDERDGLLKRMGYDVKKAIARLDQLTEQTYALIEQRKKSRKSKF